MFEALANAGSFEDGEPMTSAEARGMGTSEEVYGVAPEEYGTLGLETLRGRRQSSTPDRSPGGRCRAREPDSEVSQRGGCEQRVDTWSVSNAT